MGSASGFNNGFSDNLGPDGFENGFSYTKKIVTDGLVLRYETSDTTSYPGSGATVTDLMGNSNASLSNSPSYSGGRLSFNGTNQYLLTNTSLGSKVTTDVTTIVMWAYPSGNGVLLSERGTPSLASDWHESVLEMVGGTMQFGLWNGASITSVVSSVATPLDKWYQFTVVYDGTKLKSYVNDAEAGSVTFSRLNPIEGETGLHYSIAAGDSTNMGNGNYANMKLGQFLVYNRALSYAEVQQNFRSSKSSYGR